MDACVRYAMTCIKWTRLDRVAAVCLSCEGPQVARFRVAELESDGYTVTTGYCARCIARFALDSFKGTRWAIPECGATF